MSFEENRVVLARVRLGMSQKELAEKSGVMRSTLSNLENGHTKPRAETFYKLAQALEVNPGWLSGLEDVEDEKPKLTA